MHRMINEQRRGWPMVRLETDFKRRSRYGDRIEVDIELFKLGTASLGLQYTIRGDDGERLFAKSTIVLTNLDTRPVRSGSRMTCVPRWRLTWSRPESPPLPTLPASCGRRGGRLTLHAGLQRHSRVTDATSQRLDSRSAPLLRRRHVRPERHQPHPDLCCHSHPRAARRGAASTPTTTWLSSSKARPS